MATVKRQQIDAISFSPEGRSLLVAGTNYVANVWDGELLIFSDAAQAPNRKHASAKTKTPSGCADAKWLDERKVVSGSDSGSVNVVEWRGDGSVENILELTGHDSFVRSVNVLQGGHKVVSTSEDRSARVWDLLDGVRTEPLAVLEGHADAVLDATFADTEANCVITTSRDSTVCLWDLRAATAPQKCMRLGVYGTALGLSAEDPNLLAVGNAAGELAFHDVRTFDGSSTARFADHSDAIGAVASGPSGYVACASDDMVVSVYKVGQAERVYQFDGHTDFVRGLAWHPTASAGGKTQQLMTAGWDGQVLSHECSIE